MISIIENLHSSGELDRLVDAGLISRRLLFYRKVYNDFLTESNHTGSIMQAMQNVADAHGISVESVRSIRRKLDC